MTALLQQHCYISVTNDSALNEQWNWQCRKVFVTFDVTHCMHPRAEVLIWYHYSLQVDPCIRLLVVESLYSINKQLLTLDAHAPQGYSSWVCVQTVTNRPGRPKDRHSIAIAWFKTRVFRKMAFSRRYRIRVATVLAYRSAILLALTGTRAYIHSRDFALPDPRGTSCTGICFTITMLQYYICLGNRYMK